MIPNRKPSTDRGARAPRARSVVPSRVAPGPLLGLVASLAIASAGCSNPDPRHPAVTAADHERAAREHLRAATTEAGRFDPAQRPSIPCPGVQLFGSGCIDHTRNPTAVHLDAAAVEKDLADDHLSRASALVAAEDEACRGVGTEDRTVGPLVGWPSPFSAQPLLDYSGATAFRGTVIDFPGGPPDADRVQALATCHRARVVGRGVPADHQCALDDPTLDVLVIATPRGTLLQLRSDDPEAGRRAWEAAHRAATASHARPRDQPHAR